MNMFQNDHVAVYVCSHVFENKWPILLIVHSEGNLPHKTVTLGFRVFAS